MQKLVLYKSDYCPYCIRVMQFIKKNNMTLDYRDVIEDPSAREELIKVGGSSQVPCLFIDGKPLYESLDIMEWLDKNYASK